MVTNDALVHAADQLHGLGNAVRLQFLRALDRIDRARAWGEDGASSLEDWVAYRYAMPWKAASDHVATMRALRRLPKIASVFGQGLLSWDVLVVLCTFVEPEQDATWAESARRRSTPHRSKRGHAAGGDGAARKRRGCTASDRSRSGGPGETTSSGSTV